MRTSGAKWKKNLAASLLLCVGLAHAVWPQRISLDWPSVSLLITGILILFSQKAMELLPYIKRLKLGEAEIEIQEKLRDLNAAVTQLEENPQKTPRSITVEHPKDTNLETTILDLATKDKGAALVRLAIEIEKMMAFWCKELGLKLSQPTWR